MKVYRPAVKSVYVLRIWIILIALLFSVIAGIIMTFSQMIGIIILLLITVSALVIEIFIIPVSIKNKFIKISDNRIIISGGIIFKHSRIISREKIIYVSRLKSPLAALFGLCSIKLYSAGSTFFIPLLNYEESKEIMKLV